jgi:hypothetical protein
MQGVQRPRDICSLFSFAWEPGNLTKEIIPYLHRGHGMDPGGPTNSEGMLLVEQRYRAHFAQSSCPHPEIINTPIDKLNYHTK